MKFLLVSLALFSTLSNAGTVCYNSRMAAVTEIFFTFKDADQNTIHESHYKYLTPGTLHCVSFYEELQQSVSIKVFHETGLIWDFKVNTCNFENITKSTTITSHGTTHSYHCTAEEM